MKKRLISFLLAVSMMLSILPAGAFAAAQNLTISQDTHRPERPGGGSSGWRYDEDTDTLTIEDGYIMADNVSYPYIACKVVNRGTIKGAIYTNNVTSENGSFLFGIYKSKPTGTFASRSKEFYTISSSDGTAFGLNSKLYNIKEAYSVKEQAVTVNAPEGKIVSQIEGADSSGRWNPTGIGTDTATFTMAEQNVTITFANKSGYTEPTTKIPLVIEDNGYPKGTQNGTKEVSNGDGWSFQMTTLESGNNEMTLVIDEGTDTSALKDKVIRVPVKCASTLKGGLYTKSVELSGNGKITGGFFTNDVKNANLSSVAIEHGDTFTVDSFPNDTLSKVYTKASSYNTITLKLTKPQELQHVGTGYYFSQPDGLSSVRLNVPEGDTVILYKRAPLTRELFKVTAPDIKVGDPVKVTVVPADGVVGLGNISIAGYYRAENSGLELLDADYVSNHADRYRVVVRVGVGTVYEGATTYSAGNLGGDNSWFFTVSEAPSNKILDTDGYPVGSGGGSTNVTNDTWSYDASRNLLILSEKEATYTLENVKSVKCSISNAGTLKDSSIKFASDDLSLSNEFGTLNNCNVEGLTYNYDGEISGGTYTAVYDTNTVSGHTNATVGVLVVDLYKPEGAYTIQGADGTKILSICGLTIDNVAQDKAIYVKTSQSTISVKTSEAVTHINGEEFSNCTDKVSTIALSSSADKSLTLNQKPASPAKYAIARKVSDDTPNLTADVITVKVNDSEAVEAAENDTITLSFDTTKLPVNTTFAGWSVTAGDDTVEVTNSTSANNASFTMPGKAVTVTYTVDINTPVEVEYEITRQHGDDLPDFTVTVNGVEVSRAEADSTVTLSLDTTQLPDNTTFAGWSVTTGDDTVDVTNGTSANNASFTMPGKAVTVTYTVDINTPVEVEYEITRQHGDDLPDFTVTVNGVEVSRAEADSTVTLSLDTTQLPENTTFAGWSVTTGDDTVEVTNGTSASHASFTMPGKAVTVTYTVTTTSDPGDTDTVISSGDGAGVAIVLGGAAIGGVAYLAGTQLYLESVLPKGAAIPVNRQQLADLLWTTAGKPQPQSSVLFTDISAEAIDSQKAARWCVEQGLMPADGTSFKPSRYTFRPQVIKAWNDLQAMQKAG